MAMTVREVKAWLQEIDDDHSIAVDDGGLALVELESAKFQEAAEDYEFGNYLELGGVPLDEEN